MLVHQSQLDSPATVNEIFDQTISSYDPLEGEPLENERLASPVIEEEYTEVLPDDFITKCQLNGEQLDLNMALCREFEGAE